MAAAGKDYQAGILTFQTYRSAFVCPVRMPETG